MKRLLCLIVLLPALLAGQRKPALSAEHIPDLGELEKMAARFSPTDLRVASNSRILRILALGVQSSCLQVAHL